MYKIKLNNLILEGVKMQKLLKVENIRKYIKRGKKNKWPKSNDKCQMCGFYKKMIHHGFYLRYYVNCHLGINEKIYIKRYYCKNCKITISLLPDFCIKKSIPYHFTYQSI